MVHIVGYAEDSIMKRSKMRGSTVNKKSCGLHSFSVSFDSRQFLGPPLKILKLRCKSANFYIFEPIFLFTFFQD